jgi:hypothetical protein
MVQLSIVSNEVEETPEPLKASFDLFWKAYPRKMSRKVAQISFNRIAWTNELWEKVLQAIENQKKSEQWSQGGGIYIPFPATWLNQERWEDEFEVEIQASPCNWPGCKSHGQTQRGTKIYCERHIQSFNRGETP